MENVTQIKEYFDIDSSLYNFFKKSAVLEAYDGTQLKRLIATCWSGHFNSTSHLDTNYNDIIQALQLASKNKKLKSEERSMAVGVLHQMKGDEENEDFLLVNCMLMEVLKPIDIVVKTLQSSKENLSSAVGVISAVREELVSTRGGLDTEYVSQMIDKFKECNKISSNSNNKRQTSTPSHFDEFVITDIVPSTSCPSNIQIYKECLDIIESEFERRFASDNIALWQAMEALWPNSNNFLNSDTLEPRFYNTKTIPVLIDFYTKHNLSLEDLKAECRIFSRVLKGTEWPKDKKGVINLVQVAYIVFNEYGDSAPILSSL